MGRYRIRCQIAAGGMGALYLGTFVGPAGFAKVVALKLIHPHLADDKRLVEMFLDEARLAAQIDHPHVCTIFDFGKAGEEYYLAMEYLRGRPMSAFLRAAMDAGLVSDPEYPRVVAKLMADACEGLHAAHELRNREGEPLQVVHRDISPGNLFVTFDGVVKVLDFGVASARERISSTTAGEVKGKFAYMAPEQLRGGKLDRRADVWAIGVTLWELLAGAPPIASGTDVSTMYQVLMGELPTPEERLPENVPIEMHAILRRAVARDPDERYANTREMGRDLARIAVAGREPIGAAEAAEWVRKLFPDGPQRALEIVEEVMRSTPPPKKLSRILVVDGARTVRAYLTRLLKDSYDVVEAGSVAEALDEIKRVPVDAIISQRSLRDGSATELCARARRANERPELVFIVTTSDPKVSGPKVFPEGVDAVIPKHVDGTTLLALLKSHLD